MKVRLGDYITEHSERNRASEDIPVYSVTNTQGFCTGYFDKEVASKDKSTYKIVPHGCFAYNPSRINVGSIDWQKVADRVIVSPLYVVFSASKQILPQYLYYYLKSDFALTFIKAASRGSVRDNLRFSALSEFPIELPSLNEQRMIASLLDKIRGIINLRQQQLQKLDDLIKARFVEMFGEPTINPMKWKKEPIEQHINLLTGYPFKSEQYVDDGVNICGGLIIMPQRIDWDNCVHWPSIDGYENYLLNDGDIVWRSIVRG